VIESGPQLMTQEDPDVADEMQRLLSDEGIQFLLAAETLDVHGPPGEEVSVTVRTTSGEQKIEGSDILVAAGEGAFPGISTGREVASRVVGSVTKITSIYLCMVGRRTSEMHYPSSFACIALLLSKGRYKIQEIL